MRRRTLLNLVLVAAAAMLTAVLWLEREPADKPTPLTGLTRDAITGVRVSYPEAPDMILKRTQAGWRLNSPVATRAEDGEVAQILRLAEAEVRREYPAGEFDPAEIGLDRPPYTVVFTPERGEPVRIFLGGEAALERSRYARIGDTVYLIPEPNIHSLDAEFSNLVARGLLAEDAQIERIELPDATLTPTDTGGWAVTPEGADRGADAAQRTVDAWRNARALWMKPATSGSKSGAGSAEAESRVRLHLADGTVKTLAVVAREPQLILRDPDLGVHYHIAADQAGPLLDMQGDKTAEAQRTQRQEITNHKE